MGAKRRYPDPPVDPVDPVEPVESVESVPSFEPDPVEDSVCEPDELPVSEVVEAVTVSAGSDESVHGTGMPQHVPTGMQMKSHGSSPGAHGPSMDVDVELVPVVEALVPETPSSPHAAPATVRAKNQVRIPAMVSHVEY